MPVVLFAVFSLFFAEVAQSAELSLQCLRALTKSLQLPVVTLNQNFGWNEVSLYKIANANEGRGVLVVDYTSPGQRLFFANTRYENQSQELASVAQQHFLERADKLLNRVANGEIELEIRHVHETNWPYREVNVKLSQFRSRLDLVAIRDAVMQNGASLSDELESLRVWIGPVESRQTAVIQLLNASEQGPPAIRRAANRVLEQYYYNSAERLQYREYSQPSFRAARSKRRPNLEAIEQRELQDPRLIEP